ncbi:MAG: hypothetical protein ACREJ3_03300, partial [Polyangiaceae bacterium]
MTVVAATGLLRNRLRGAPLHLPVSGALALVGTALVSVATGASLTHGRVGQLTVGACAFGAMAALAWTVPRIFFRVLALGLMLVPVYVVPAFHGLPLLPAVVASWTLALAVAVRNALVGRWPRITGIDVASALVFAALALDVGVGGAKLRTAVFVAYLWLGPYLAGRFVASRIGVGESARALAGAALVVVPLAIAEAVFGLVLFAPSNNQAVDARWGLPIERLGAVRAEAAFGHPIALSMVLAAAALLAFGTSTFVASRKAARIWQAVALALVVGQTVAVSRKGWFVLGVGLLLVFARRVRVSRRRFLASASVCLAVVALLPQRAAVFATIASLSGGSSHTSLASNTAYREELLRRLEHPTSLPLFGNGVVPANVSV